MGIFDEVKELLTKHGIKEEEPPKTYTEEELAAAVAEAKKAPEPKTFTQEEFDKAVADAKAEAAKEQETKTEEEKAAAAAAAAKKPEMTEGKTGTTPPGTKTAPDPTKEQSPLDKLEQGTMSEKELIAYVNSDAMKADWEQIIRP